MTWRMDMKTFSLLSTESPIKGEYCYKRAGTKIRIAPDMEREKTDAEVYTAENGNLCNKRGIAFLRETVLGTGVDICFSFRKNVYIDSVELLDTVEAGKTEVLTEENGKRKKIGAGDARTSVNYMCDNMILRIHSTNEDMKIGGIKILGADLENCLYPMAVHSRWDGGSADISDIGISALGEDETFAAGILVRELGRKMGKEAKISENALIKLKIRDTIIDGSGKAVHGVRECFSLDISENGIAISGTDKRALTYAVHAFSSLIHNGRVPCGYVFDKPYMEFRGMHLGMPSRNNISFFKSFISDYMVPLRYNTLFLELNGVMRFDSHPEIAECWADICEKYRRGEVPRPHHYDMLGKGEILEKADVLDLVRYAESFGIEVIPEIQSLSHVQYLTVAHPEIAEKNTIDSDAEIAGGDDEPTPDEFYDHCYCPSNEKSYEILFDIADEILDLIKPKRFVSMGHDEVYLIGTCDKCRKKTPAELYASDVNRIYDYLKKHGLRMMIWGDMLHDCLNYETYPAIDMIPKDIILLDFVWYFKTGTDIEDRLLSHGFEVILGNMYSSHYPRFKTRAEKKGIIGAQISTWCEMSLSCHTQAGKMFDTAFSANMMWSRAYCGDLRNTYTYALEKYVLPELKDRMYRADGVGDYFFSPAQGKETAVMYNGRDRAIDKDCACVSGDCACDDYPTEYTALKLGKKAEKLSFIHGTDGTVGMLNNIEWSTPIGKYVIKYSDGTTENVRLIYGENTYCKEKYASVLPSFYYRHAGYRDIFLADPITGKTPEGRDYTLYKLTWKNPHPEKDIAEVVMRAETDTSAVLELFGIICE